MIGEGIFCVILGLTICSGMEMRSEEMTLTVFKEWPYLDLPTRLKYLLLEADWKTLENELSPMLSRDRADEKVSRSTFLNFVEDYQDPEIVEQFFDECDADNDNLVEIVEYAGCRGNRDRYGNIYDKNEYEFREEVILRDFEAKLQSGEYLTDVYKYDEDGIIID
jgi:hypothetical protein